MPGEYTPGASGAEVDCGGRLRGSQNAGRGRCGRVATRPGLLHTADVLAKLLDSVLDASIVYSFDAKGYRRHARRFCADDLAVDLSDRVCLVTGANGGIGLEIARALARLRAEVFLLCRDPERGEAARQAVRGDSPNRTVRLELMDVSSLDSVRAFCARWQGRSVDVLVHNAGLIPAERTLTEEGLELAFATHVVGPFLLSRLLEGALADGDPGRVLFVSSGGMYTERLSLEDLDWQKRSPYDGVKAYAQTKRMQVVLAEQLAAYWKAKGILCHSMHPGWVDTPGLQESLPNFSRWMSGRLRTPAEGADTVVWLAASRAAAQSSGKFWLDRVPRRTHLGPWTRETPEVRDALWVLCEERAGLRA